MIVDAFYYIRSSGAGEHYMYNRLVFYRKHLFNTFNSKNSVTHVLFTHISLTLLYYSVTADSKITKPCNIHKRFNLAELQFGLEIVSSSSFSLIFCLQYPFHARGQYSQDYILAPSPRRSLPSPIVSSYGKVRTNLGSTM